MSAGRSVRTRRSATAEATASSRLIFSTLTGLTALAVLLQGLWAGEFLHYNGAQRDSWLNVHARGGEVAVALALIATLWALLRLRSRWALIAEAAVLTLLLAAVAYVGGLIADDDMDNLIPLHIPLALAALILATSVTWQGLRAPQSAP